MITAPCPKPAALTPIPAQDCKFKFDQILRFGFQRNTDEAPFHTDATTPNPIEAKASWDLLTAAVDDTKIILSPIAMGVEIPSSEGQYEGGNDNSTPFGLQMYLGEGGITVIGQHRNLAPAVYTALQHLSYESDASLGVANLRIWLINKNGELIHETGDAEGDAWGIPVYNYRIGSPGSTGFNSDNIIPFSFGLQPDWADKLKITKPSFQILSY